MQFSCIVFDLDGTLVDTSASLTIALNEVLEHLGRRSLDSLQVRKMGAEGLRTLLRRAINLTGPALDDVALSEALALFRDGYDRHLLELSRPCPSMLQMARELSDEGATLGVLTNKHERTALKLLEHFGMCERLDYLVAGDMGVARKPDPAGLLQIMELAGATADKTLFVGDDRIDLLTARNAGVKYAVCSPFADRSRLFAQGADYVLYGLDQVVQLARGEPRSLAGSGA